MNDIDTSAVRAEYQKIQVNPGTRAVIGELCDALDEARTERDDIKRAAENGAGKWLTTVVLGDRIVELEARIVELEADITIIDDLASVDRARIVAALEIGYTLTSPCDEHCKINDVRRALTGDTQ